MSEKRYFDNKLDASKMAGFDIGHLHDHVSRLVGQIDTAIADGDFPPNDFSVYTGLAGVAYLHYFLWKKSGVKEYLERAGYLIRRCPLKGRGITFLTGDPGILALDAVISYKYGSDPDRSIQKLVGYFDMALEDETDELLYGRSGYLYALIFARHELGYEVLGYEIEQVAKRILESGRAFSRSLRWNEPRPPPLMWQWHGKLYLGAAHGVAGIIHTLLLAIKVAKPVRTSIESGELVATLDWLLTQRFVETGNLMSSVGSSSGDKLVQWCHGAPALPHVLLRFSKVVVPASQKDYVEPALQACEVIWQRGLLRKGFGICHGAAGNAYSLLAAHRATGDIVYLHRALAIAVEFCGRPDKWPIARQPDRPFSLFEGCAGTAWLLADLCYSNGSTALTSFPAYELIPRD